MAKIRDFAFTEGTVTASSIPADVPVHETGDLLIAFVNTDSAITINIPAGWTQITPNRTTNACSNRTFYRFATSNAETVTITLSGAETYTVTIVSVIGANTTTPIDVVQERTTASGTQPFTTPNFTTTTANCLLFSFLSTDSGMGPTCEPGWTNITIGDAGANSGGVAYKFKEEAGLVTGPRWYAQLNDTTNAVNMAIRDDGNGLRPPYFFGSTGEYIDFLAATSTTFGGSYPNGVTITSAGGKTLAYDAPGTTNDSGLNPYNAAITITPSGSTNGSTIGGPQLNIPVRDIRNRILLTSFIFTTPRDYIDLSKSTDSGQRGMCLLIRNASNNYRIWTIGTKYDATTKSNDTTYVAIQTDQSTPTHWASSGANPSNAVASIFYGAQGRYGAVSARFSYFVTADVFELCGGSAASPLTFPDYVYAFNNSLGAYPILQVQGSASTLLAPVKFGGNDQIVTEVNLRTFQYRRQADGEDYYDWHVDANRVGFEFDCRTSADSIKFLNCTFVAETTQYFRFATTHSALSTVDLSGSNIINFNITLRSSVSLSDVGFINCPSFLLNSASLLDCSFRDTKVTAAYTDLANISQLSFESTGTGHAIELTGTLPTPQTVTLTNIEFAGYAVSNGSTGNEALYVNIASGTLTLNISGGTVPSIRTAGATVIVQNIKTFTIQNIVANTEIRIYRQSDLLELAGAEDVGNATPGAVNLSINTDADNIGKYTTSYSYNYTSDTPIFVVAHSLTQQWLRTSAILKSTDSSLKIAQIADRQYLNP